MHCAHMLTSHFPPEESELYSLHYVLYMSHMTKGSRTVSELTQ